MAVLAGCTSAQVPASSTASAGNASPRPTFVGDVPFTETIECGTTDCTVPLDVLAPSEGQALPTLVLVPGGPVTFGERRYLTPLAAELARRGAVVFLATYRSTATGNTEGESLQDVRCSIRYARSAASRYGADPQRVVLIGHSVGSNLVLQTAVTPETDTPGCLAEGDGIPEAVVGLSEFVVSLSSAAESGPPMLLLGGADDPFSATGSETAQRLREAGFEAEYRELETDHEGMVNPMTPGVVDMILDAVKMTAQPTS